MFKSLLRTSARSFCLQAIVGLAALVAASASHAQVRISAVYGGGGASAAGFNADFVELYNAGTTAVSFSSTPFALRYASATGASTWSNAVLINNGTIGPGGYFLVRTQNTQALGNTLSTPDFTSASIDMSATAGKIALYQGDPGTIASTTCPPLSNSGASLVDFVGYGATTDCRSPLTGGSTSNNASSPSTTSYLIRLNVAQSVNPSTNSNFADFASVPCATTMPRNSRPVDGTADSSYGSALATQNTATSFGNATTTTVTTANGSELDQLFGTVCGSNLHLTIAGNLENNGNRLIIFVDSVSGGQNSLRGDNQLIGRLGFNGDGAGAPGMKLPSSMTADFVFVANLNSNTMFMDYATLPTTAGGTQNFLGQSTVFGAGPGTLTGGNFPSGSGSGGTLMSVNNSNTAGVDATTGTSGANVTTGVELTIPLSMIGNPTGPVQVFAILVNSSYTAGANQSLAGCNGCPQFGDSAYRDWSTTAATSVNVAVGTPSITTQPPSAVSACVSTSPTLTISATGLGLQYQWQISTDAGVTWVNASGTGPTTSSFTLPSLLASANNNRYRCIVYNGCATVVSNTVTLTVNTNPTAPVPVASPSFVNAGGSSTLTAVPGAGETIDWFTGACGTGTQIATGQTSITVTTLAASTTYFARARNTTTGCVSGACGSVTVNVVAPAQVVINQIYSRGNTTGSSFNRNYIELYNRGNTAVNLSTWSIQTASSGTGTTWTRTNLTGSIPANGYYLIATATTAGTNGANLPTPDVAAAISLGTTDGKVALVANQTNLATGACYAVGTNAIVDFVGYGTAATCFEGSGPAPANGAVTAATFRNGSGSTDSNSNVDDFATGTPTPRNAASPTQSPTFVGACCLPSGLCSVVSSTTCASQGGNYGGDNSLCTVQTYISQSRTQAITDDISSSGTVALGTTFDGLTGSTSLDSGSGLNIPLGFNFTFFGTTRSKVSVFADGYVSFATFSTGATSTFTPQSLPSATAPNDLIAGLWGDNLLTNLNQVRYATLGSAPYRRFIVQWTSVGAWTSTAPTGSMTFQVILYETSNLVEVRYGSISYGTATGNRTVGVENSFATIATPIFNALATPGISANTSFVFTPTNNCSAPVGACCSGSTCTSVSLIDCQLSGGSFQGLATICSPNPCITGACCLPNGTCVLGQLATACVGAGGIYQGDNSVCPVSCPATGACCNAASCSIAFESVCTSQSGVYQGDGTLCTPNNPCIGACCTAASTCTNITQAACLATAGNSFAGSGTVCATSPCVTGRCCLTDGSCSVLTATGCTTAGGIAGPASSTCGSIVYGSPTTVTAAFEDISTTGTAYVAGANGGSTSLDTGNALNIPIGFNLQVFGSSVSALNIQVNGYVYFGSGSVTGDSLSNWSTTGTPANVVFAPLNADLLLSSAGQITYQTLGTAPNRRFIVQWTNVGRYNSGSPTGANTFQVAMFEGTNVVQYRYGTINPGVITTPTAQIGIRGASGAPLANTIPYSQVSAGNTAAQWIPTGFTCPQPTGACCVSGNCSQLDGASCISAGGSFFGVGVTCGSITCPAAPLAVTNQSATPSAVAVGCSTKVLATVVPGGGGVLGPSTGIAVSADLSSIGGSNSVPLTDAGDANDDGIASNNIWGVVAQVGFTTTTGGKTIAITATDLEGRSDTKNANLTVNSYLTATALATPSSQTGGASAVFTVTVTQAAGVSCQTSTALDVNVNLSSIGGSPTQQFFDDGLTGGDATANDGIFTFAYLVPALQTPGTFTLPATVSDAQGRSATASISFSVRPSNDDCFGAIAVTDAGLTNATNAGATLSTPASAISSTQADVWYTYIPCATGTIILDTCGSRNLTDGMDTTVQVYTGSCVSLTSLVSNDDHSSTITGCATVATADSRVTFSGTAGTLYYIRIGRFSTTGQGAINRFNLRITAPQVSDPTAPSSDPSICAGASATISATVGSGGDTIDWFTDSCGGTLVGSGASLSVSPAVTTTFFGRTRNTTSNCSSTGCVIVTVNVTPSPAVSAGSDSSACPGATVSLTGSGSNFTSVAWSGGTGTFSSSNTLATNYILGPGDTGSVVLTLTATGTAPCTTAASTVTITVNPAPSAPTLSSDVSICSGSGTTLSATAGPGETVEWFTGSCGGTPAGTGSSLNVSPTTTTTYYARAVSANNCPSATCAQVTVTVVDEPTAVAGSNLTISACTGLPLPLNGVVTNASSVQWTSTGTGTFANAGSAVTSYTFSAADRLASSIQLTLTAQPTAPCATPAVSTLTVNITPPPATAYVDDDYVGLPFGTSVNFPHDGQPGPYTIGCDAFATVQAGVNAVVASTVIIAPGTYLGDITITLNNLNLLSSGGAGVTTLVGSKGDATNATVRINANNVTVAGFTITREGNNTTDWNDPTLNSAGIAIQGIAFTGATIRDNIITGNRSAIDINNSNGHTIRNNEIVDNRTGVIFRNQTDSITFTENNVSNNWTVGILFLDGSGGTNVPPQSAANCTFSGNKFSGNWYGQIVDRQSGGSLPAPGSNVKNFSRNSFGTATPVISAANSTEPGYSSQIPVAFGGTAVPPGGQPDVLGPASANFDITPYLNIATDTNINYGSGTFGFQGDYSNLTVTSALAQSGSTGRIQEGHDAVDSGGSVAVTAGTFTENLAISKLLTIDGAGSGDCASGADPMTQTVVTAANTAVPTVTINDVGGASALSRLTLKDMRITGSTVAGVQLTSTAVRSFYLFDNLAVANNGGTGLEFVGTSGFSDAQVLDSSFCANYTGIRSATSLASFDGLLVDGCEISNSTFNGLAMHGSTASSFNPTNITVSNSDFASNGQSNNLFQGSGDLSFFEFNGNATLTNVNVVTTGRVPVQFRGRGAASPTTWLPAGNITISGLIVTGSADRPAMYIHFYNDVTGFNLNNVNLTGITNLNPPNTGFSVGGIILNHTGAAPFNLGNTSFPCQGPGYVGLAVFGSGGASATCSTVFAGATTLTQKEACVFDVDDFAGVGQVTFLDGEITDQPDPLAVCLGSAANFSVTAIGNVTGYQWLLDGNPILGANSASYNIPAVGLADLGAYSVQVITGCGTLTSTTAALTANPATVASINEASLSVCQGGSATFTTTASGFGSLTYQWLKDGNPILGANNPSLTINPAALSDAGNYSVVVTGGCGSVTTSASALTVETGPSIDTQPASVVACNGQSVTFTVAASGSAPISYQWRKDGNPIGANSASYTVPAAGAGDVGSYDCIVTNTCGSTTTSAASLSIAPTPSVVYVDDGYVGLPIGTAVNFPHDGNPGPYAIGCNAFATIQGGVDNVLNNGTVNVAAGSYNESVMVSGRPGIKLYGAGASSTTIVGPKTSSISATVRLVSSNDVEIAGFTITRDGNNPADWASNVNNNGVVVGSCNNTLLRDCIVTGNRNGINFQYTVGAVIRNNIITNNRTGAQFVDSNTNGLVTQNVITDNWTMGILFRDEVPTGVNTSGTVFTNNHISGNWYGGIEYRNPGGNPVTTQNFSGNWLGTTSPVISNVSGGEPGYTSQIPVVFGGTAVPPGGAPDVKGDASANFDITPYLNAATDTNVSTGFGTFGFQGDYSALTVTSSLAQSGSTGRIQEGVDLATTGGTVNVLAGTFSGVTEVDKSVTLLGANAGVCSTAARGTETIVRPATSQALDGILFYLTASNVTIDGFTLTGDNGASGDGQILATGEADVGNIISNGSFDNTTTYPFVHVKNIEIVNNFILAANDVAVNLYNDGSFPVSDNNDISCNTFTNLAGQNTISNGGPYNRITVLLYNDTYANIDDNVIGTAASPVNIGVQTGNNFRAATNPANATMNDNNIVSETVGLFHNLHYANASPWTIANNTVTSAASSTVNTGIVAWSLYSGATATLTNNTVANCDVGYEFWNNPAVPSVTMSGGSITGCNVGALFTNFSTYGAGAATETILNNVSITAAPGGIGLRVNDDAAPAAVDAITAIVNSSTVSGQLTGASVTGPFAGLMVTGGALASNATGASIAEGVALFQGVNLSGNSANGVTVSGGAIVDLGQCGTGTDVTGLGISSGNNNLTGYGFDAAAPFAIANSNSSSEPNVLAFNNNFTAGGTLDVELVLSNNSNAALSDILYSDSSGPSILTQPAGGAFCPGTPVNLSVVAYNAVSYQWFFGANPVGTNSPSYSIPALSPAQVGNYTVVVTDACGLTVTSSVAAVGLLPLPSDPASASADNTLYCSDSVPTNITLSALGGSGTTLEWSTSCGGSAIGTGSPLTIAAPSSTTTYFARWTNSCGASNCVSVTINVTDAPVVNAGSGSSICATDSASLLGTATNAASVLWTGGTGVFSSPTTLATTYTPGIGETGSVVLTLTATGNAPCASASSTVTINISPAPTASAGSNISSCYTVPVLLNGSATNASSTLWSTSGSGTFSSASSLATSYFPSPADITAGTVTLTLTAQAIAPCSTPAVSSLVLTLTPQPTATYSDDGYVGLPNGTSVDFPYTGGSGPYIIGCDAFATIQGAVNAVTSAGTVSVAVGNYVEDVLVNKSIAVLGGFGGTSTVSGAIGGQGSTFRLDASNVTLAGFTITREGNNTTDWTNPNLNSAGIAIQGAFTGNLIRDNIITGNRSAIDINNSSGHTLRNNDITNNHTGVIFRNQTDNITFIENAVTNNRTIGILFLDASGGSNSPVQSAANCTFANNNLSGNWYGQIEDRQIGGSLPAPGSNLKNFSGNWLGTTSPVVSNVTGGEPGYASHIPVVFGGTATPPGGQPDVKGAASANFDITPYLNVATDTNVSTGFGTFGFQGDYSALTVTSSLAQTGSSGRIQEGHDLVTAAGDVNVTPGTFAENTVITKHVKITGSGSGGGGASGNPATDTIVSPSSGIAFLIDDVGGASAANRLAINNLRIQGGTTGVKLQVANAQTRSFFGFNNLAAISVTDKGIAFDPKTSGGGLTDVLVENSFFNFGGNIGIGTAAVPPPALAQLDGVTIDNCEFKNNFSVGVYIGGQDGVFSPTNITVSNSTFVDNGTSTIAGTGHLHFFWFNGNASLSNLSLSMTGTNVTRQPLQFRGWGSASTATWQPLGTVSLNNVDISGRANRPGIYIQRYASLAGLSLNGVDLSGMISTNGINSFAVGMQVSHIGAPFALNDTIFPCQGPGYFGLTMESTGGASASCATVFTGATTLSQKEACVADFNDVPSLGDVTFLDAEITDQPDPVSVCLGTPAAFSVTASGPGLTYQWYLDGNPILGANNSTYNIASVGFADAGNYTVDVISACGTITSTSASLAIIPGPVAATSASASIPTYCLDSVPPSITLSALGGSGLTFNWTAGSCGGTVIGSGTSISIPAPLVTTTYFGYWTNTCGNSTCVSVTVTPVAAPTANAGGTYVICADGVASVLGSATSASSTMWTTSGDGIFIDPTALSTVYIPGTNDISLGSATLTLTANPNAPCATAAVSNTTLTINPLPVAPASLATSHDNFCAGSVASINLSATGGSGAKLTWFANTCGGAPIGSGPAISIAAPSVTTTYFARWVNSCGTSACASVTVNVNPLPATPSVGSDSAICAGEGFTLTGSVPSGITIDWFEGSCGGTLVGSGTSLPVSPAATTTYFARARNSTTGCISTACATLTVTVNPLPATPVAGSGGTICDGESFTLTATVGSGETVDWFTGSCGGTPVGSGASLPVSPITTTTYFARARNTTTSCVSAACATVTVTVNPLPATPVAGSGGGICDGESFTLTATVGSGETVDWFTGSCGGTLVGSGTSLSVSPTSTTTYFARARNTTTSCVCTACASVTVTVNPLPVAPTVGAGGDICDGGTFTLTGSVPSGFDIDWYDGSCGGTLVGSGSSLPVSPTVTTTYYARARNTSTSCVSTTCATVTVNVNPLPATPVAGSGGSICSGEPFTLTATVGSGEDVEWFTGSCGSIPAGSGTSLSVNPLVTTTYYARAKNTTTNCVSAACASVTVNVTTTPTSPTAANVDVTQFCTGSAPATITLSATGGSGGVYTWYSGSCGSTPVGTGSPLTIAAPSSTTTYFVRREDGVCFSASCQSVTVTVDASPVAPASAGVDSPTFCSGTLPTITLSATGGSGDVLKWYSSSCGSTPVGTGSPLTIAAPLTSTTYFARWETTACGNSACASVAVTVNASPVAPTSITTSSNNYCAGSVTTLTLTAVGGSGDSIQWFSGSCGSTPIGTGASITIAAPVTTTTYFARWSTVLCGDSTCASATVTVNPVTGACCTGWGNMKVCTVVAPIDCIGLPTPTQAYRGNCTTCSPTRCCGADYNNNGTIEINDIFDFLNAWFALVPSSDFNHSGTISIQDIFDFLNAWFAGC